MITQWMTDHRAAELSHNFPQSIHQEIFSRKASDRCDLYFSKTSSYAASICQCWKLTRNFVALIMTWMILELWIFYASLLKIFHRKIFFASGSHKSNFAGIRVPELKEVLKIWKNILGKRNKKTKLTCS